MFKFRNNPTIELPNRVANFNHAPLVVSYSDYHMADIYNKGLPSTYNNAYNQNLTKKLPSNTIISDIPINEDKFRPMAVGNKPVAKLLPIITNNEKNKLSYYNDFIGGLVSLVNLSDLDPYISRSLNAASYYIKDDSINSYISFWKEVLKNTEKGVLFESSASPSLLSYLLISDNLKQEFARKKLKLYYLEPSSLVSYVVDELNMTNFLTRFSTIEEATKNNNLYDTIIVDTTLLEEEIALAIIEQANETKKKIFAVCRINFGQEPRNVRGNPLQTPVEPPKQTPTKSGVVGDTPTEITTPEPVIEVEAPPAPLDSTDIEAAPTIKSSSDDVLKSFMSEKEFNKVAERRKLKNDESRIEPDTLIDTPLQSAIHKLMEKYPKTFEKYRDLDYKYGTRLLEDMNILNRLINEPDEASAIDYVDSIYNSIQESIDKAKEAEKPAKSLPTPSLSDVSKVLWKDIDDVLITLKFGGFAEQIFKYMNQMDKEFTDAGLEGIDYANNKDMLSNILQEINDTTDSTYDKYDRVPFIMNIVRRKYYNESTDLFYKKDRIQLPLATTSFYLAELPEDLQKADKDMLAFIGSVTEELIGKDEANKYLVSNIKAGSTVVQFYYSLLYYIEFTEGKAPLLAVNIWDTLHEFFFKNTKFDLLSTAEKQKAIVDNYKLVATHVGFDKDKLLGNLKLLETGDTPLRGVPSKSVTKTAEKKDKRVPLESPTMGNLQNIVDTADKLAKKESLDLLKEKAKSMDIPIYAKDKKEDLAMKIANTEITGEIPTEEELKDAEKQVKEELVKLDEETKPDTSTTKMGVVGGDPLQWDTATNDEVLKAIGVIEENPLISFGSQSPKALGDYLKNKFLKEKLYCIVEEVTKISVNNYYVIEYMTSKKKEKCTEICTYAKENNNPYLIANINNNKLTKYNFDEDGSVKWTQAQQKSDHKLQLIKSFSVNEQNSDIGCERKEIFPKLTSAIDAVIERNDLTIDKTLPETLNQLKKTLVGNTQGAGYHKVSRRKNAKYHKLKHLVAGGYITIGGNPKTWGPSDLEGRRRISSDRNLLPLGVLQGGDSKRAFDDESELDRDPDYNEKSAYTLEDVARLDPELAKKLGLSDEAINKLRTSVSSNKPNMGGVVNRLHNGGGKYVPKVRTLGGAAPYKGGASFGSYAEKRKLKLFSTIEVINGINSNVYELIR